MDMTNKMQVYFAHPYSSVDMLEKNMIIEELKLRNLKVHNPFDGEEKILKKYGVNDYYENPNWEMAREIWTKDIKAIVKSNLLVAWLPIGACGMGTAQEVVIAYNFNKFIQIISPILHPSFAVYADQLFISIKDFINQSEYKWKNYK